MGQEDHITKKIKDMEDKIGLLDAKIVFLFKKVSNISQTLENIASKGIISPSDIRKEEPSIPQRVLPSYTAPIKEEVTVKADSLAAAIRDHELRQPTQVPIPETVPVVMSKSSTVPITEKVFLPIKPKKERPKKPKKVRPAKEPFSLIKFIKNEENLPFFLFASPLWENDC